MRVIGIILVVTLAAAGGVLIWRPAEQPTPIYYEAVTVARGDLTHSIRETGQLAPREPVLVKNAFHAKLKWIVEDGSWVDAGETVFVVEADERIEEASQKRASLISERQKLRLAELQRAYTVDTEGLKVTEAERRLELEQLRYRILTSQPVGGRELISLHEALLPHEREQRELRSRFENLQDAFLAAQDTFLEAQDVYESAKNNLLRTQALIDELEVVTDRPVEDLQPEELKQLETKKAELTSAREAYAANEAELPALREQMLASRQAATTAEAPLPPMREQLDAAEAETRELYIRLEIEKRGLQLAQYQLDEQATQMRLADAELKLRDGQAAFAAGAISQASLDDLLAATESLRNDLEIVGKRIEIESRPPAPEEVEEGRMRLKKAEAEAAAARASFEQIVSARDADIQLAKAQIAKLEHELDSVAQFPEIIEANIATAERELELLDPENKARRAELQQDLVKLRQDLETARDKPPQIYTAPVSGLVRLKLYGGRDRPTQAGDEWWEEDAIVMIYPPENLEVHAYLNEVNVNQVSPGMPVRLVIPSLDDRQLRGEVLQVAAIGRDKFERRQSWHEKQVYAGVTQFEMRVKLAEVPEDVRQGMTVVIEIELGRREDVIWLPAGAVLSLAGDHAVRLDRGGPLQPVTGEFFSYNAFIVDSGLTPGQQIWIERRKNL